MPWQRETFKKIKQIPREEHVLPGTALCAGCGGLEGLRLAAKVLGDPQAEPARAFIAGGFRDTTRIAAANTAMWRDICLANREALLRELLQYANELHGLYQALEKNDAAKLEEVFSEARKVRSNWTPQ